MATLFQDFWFTARMMRKQPAYTLVVVLSLSFGVAAVTSVASLLGSVLFDSYGPVDSDRWVYIWEHRINSESLNQISASVPNYRDWKEHSNSVFSEMVIWLPWSYTASGTGAGGPERVRAAVISASVFSTLKLPPALGRLLTDDDSNSNERRVVLSYAFWRRAYNGDPQIVGRVIRLNSAAHTVVGVAPQGFAFPPEDQVDVWTALPASALGSADRAQRGYRVAALLRPGTSLTSARSAMNVICQRMATEFPEDKGYGVQLVPMREGVAGDFRAPLAALSGAVGFALFLLCLNIGYLRVVYLQSRRREFALRIALGAGRAVLIRQLLMETSVLFCLGGSAGIVMAPMCIRLLLSFVPPSQIPWLHVQISGAALTLAIAATASSAGLGGLLPALRVIHSDLTVHVRGGGQTTSSHAISDRMRSVMIAAQIALAFVPLCGASLLVESFLRLERVGTGFAIPHRISLEIYAPRGHYPGVAQISALAEAIRMKVGALPGVAHVGLSQAIPFSPGARWLQALSRSDPRALANAASLPLVRYSVITPGYFDAIGIPLKAGRLIGDSDSAATEPVVVVNEKLARVYFPGEDAVGKRIWVGHAESLAGMAPRKVVGVVGDTRMYALDQDPDPSVWVPMTQQQGGEDIWRNLFLVADAEDGSGEIVPAIRGGLRSIDQDLASFDVSYMSDRISDSLWRQRLSSSVLGVFSLATLAIAILGVFGVTAYLVALGTRDIGIRMALGATPARIWKMVIGRNLLVALLGIAIGMAGSMALTRLLKSLLFGVQSTDPATLGTVAIALAAAAVAASYIPARRAAAVDPLVALRSE